MQLSNYGTHPCLPDPRFAYSGCALPQQSQHAPMQTEPQLLMVPSVWMTAGLHQATPTPHGQQVLKLQELLRFDPNAFNLWQPKADATQQVWPQQSSQTDADTGQESTPGGPSELVWENAEDVEEILSAVAKNAEYCGGVGLVSCLHTIAKLSENDAFGSIGGLEALVNDWRLASVLSSLRSKAHELSTSRTIMRAVWAFGKLGLKGKDVQGIIAQLVRNAPPILDQFSCQELSNTLWGLARLSESMHGLQEGITLAYAVMAQGVTKLASFSTQCLTNSLWAVAKLGLRGEEVKVFANECLLQIHAVMFKEMSPQGLANSLWACAKLQADGRGETVLDTEVAGRFCVDAARRAQASEDLLSLFFPQELSMALWAMAKLLGRRARALSNDKGLDPVWRFAEAVAMEAASRIGDFSPQGVSTIAWSLATLDVANRSAATCFFEAAATVAAENIQDYPPQAIANCCWAFNRVGNKEQVLSKFGRAAAVEALRRIDSFSWQDCSGIVSALMNSEPHAVEVRQLAMEVVISASGQCSRIGTQALLNLALSGVRLKLDLEVMLPLAHGLGQAFASRSLNEIDNRQWEEVQRYCGLQGQPTAQRGRSGKGWNRKAAGNWKR
mmetsp:Transcript_41410/g.96234  ORF Transcript_41410/g.96234 Transcript_41410/m.96234 type:complete len:614 (+) Transcript_41410:31-1872(+)